MVHLAFADISKIRESFNLNHVITTFHHLTQVLRRAGRVIGAAGTRLRSACDVA
jgi:hypothetical protein